MNSMNLNDLKLEFDQVQYIQSLNNLNTLYKARGFKNQSLALKELNKNNILLK